MCVKRPRRVAPFYRQPAPKSPEHLLNQPYLRTIPKKGSDVRFLCLIRGVLSSQGPEIAYTVARNNEFITIPRSNHG